MAVSKKRIVGPPRKIERHIRLSHLVPMSGKLDIILSPPRPSSLALKMAIFQEAPHPQILYAAHFDQKE